MDYILVVEDDASIRDAICESLILDGFQAVCVEHGAAARRHLRSAAPPCLILLDLMMPIMDGWSFREITLRDPTLARIPVVVMTAADGKRAASARASVVLQKPLDLDKVMEVIGQYCPSPALTRR